MLRRAASRASNCRTQLKFQNLSLSTRKTNSTPAIEAYKKDRMTLVRWLDIQPIKRTGKSFDGEWESRPLSNKHTTEYFPPIKAYSLEHKNIIIPDDFDAKVKLVTFSFQDYGNTHVRKWMKSIVERFPQELADNSIVALEISFVEFRFLSIAKNAFTSGIKNLVDPSRNSFTGVAFGGLVDFANSLTLPHKFTGYVFLVDRENKVRWKCCGEPKPEELELLFKYTEQLRNEP